MPHSLVLSRRVRKTPYEERVFKHGAQAFTVYNHMLLASVYRSLEEDYAHLCEHVQLWDVAAERQVEVRGPDALELVELVTPRDVASVKIGQGVYAPLVDENGGIVNDPIILRLAHDRFWISIADSDVALWMKGLAVGKGLDVTVFEPDVSPLAVQGPKAEDLLVELVGDHVRDIRFFWFIEATMAGASVLIARSGWSGKGGFEIYLQDSAAGLDLWDLVFEAGKKFNIRAGCPNQIERMETGLLSYGSDMTLNNNPFECGLERFCSLTKTANYIGKGALQKIASEPLIQRLVNLRIETDTPFSLRNTLSVQTGEGLDVGFVTSQAYSQAYGCVLAFAYVSTAALKHNSQFVVIDSDGSKLSAQLCNPKWQPKN